MKQKTLLLTAGLALIFVSCVGTDFINEPSPDADPAKLRIVTTVTAIRVDSMLQFRVEAVEADGNINTGIMPLWRSSDSSIVGITPGGLATGLQSGQAWVHAYLPGYTGDSLLLGVVENETVLASIMISPQSAVIRTGDSLQFNATAFDLSGNVIDSVQFNWSGSNGMIVSIDSSGLAFGKSGGMAEIVAAAQGVFSLPAQIEVRDSVRTGSFESNPANRYAVSGSVQLGYDQNGDLLLKFGSDFKTDNGPGVYIYLTTAPHSLTPDHIELGPILSVNGAQTYTVPAAVGLFQYDYVLVHCKPFNVPFGSARLE